MSDASRSRKVLHEPIAPVFFSVYATLISVTQGVALGGLFYIFTHDYQMDLPFISRAVTTFIVICLVWHRYIVHTQYLAWRLGFLDTIVPMSIAISEFFIIISIPKSTSEFFVAFATLPFLGCFSYGQALYKYTFEETRILVADYFSEEGKEFAPAFLRQLSRFGWQALTTMVLVAISCLFIAKYIDDIPLDEKMKAVLSTGMLSVFLLLLFRFDLRRSLNHSNLPALKRYSW